jgi:hypothetical protein
MKRKVRDEIRALLRSKPDGLTTAQMCLELRLDDHAVRRTLPGMPDLYIDRWVKSGGPLAAVWCAVEVPENCPRPPARYRTEAEKEQQRVRSREAARRKAEADRAEKERIKALHKLSNLTVIRGAWPYA